MSTGPHYTPLFPPPTRSQSSPTHTHPSVHVRTSNDRFPKGAYTGVGRTAAPPPAAAAGLVLLAATAIAAASCCVMGWVEAPLLIWWLDSCPGDGADWNLGGTEADTASKLNRRCCPPPLPSTGTRAIAAAPDLWLPPPLLLGVGMVVVAAGVVLLPRPPLEWGEERGARLWLWWWEGVVVWVDEDEWVLLCVRWPVGGMPV